MTAHTLSGDSNTSGGTIRPINRMAAIIRPRKVFEVWLDRQPVTDPLVDRETIRSLISNVVLIEDATEYDRFKQLFRENWRVLALTVLNQYGRADGPWPEGLTAETFPEWFDVELMPTVWDTGDQGDLESHWRFAYELESDQTDEAR